MYEYVKYFTYSYLSKKTLLKMNYVLFLAQEKNQPAFAGRQEEHALKNNC